MFAFLIKKKIELDPGEHETSLGNILKMMGAISEAHLEILVDRQKVRPEEKIGELAVESGFCTNDDLRYAIKAQLGLREAGSNKIRIYASLHKNNINRSKTIYKKRQILNEAILAKVG